MRSTEMQHYLHCMLKMVNLRIKRVKRLLLYIAAIVELDCGGFGIQCRT